MELTQAQIEFLNTVCYGKEYWTLNSEGKVDVRGEVNVKNMNLIEIPVKFGRVDGYFNCSNNNLTTLKNCPNRMPDWVGFIINNNNLTDYFKSIKEEDFIHWDKLDWFVILNEYPFLINIANKHLPRRDVNLLLKNYPQTKLYIKG